MDGNISLLKLTFFTSLVAQGGRGRCTVNYTGTQSRHWLKNFGQSIEFRLVDSKLEISKLLFTKGLFLFVISGDFTIINLSSIVLSNSY